MVLYAIAASSSLQTTADAGRGSSKSELPYDLRLFGLNWTKAGWRNQQNFLLLRGTSPVEAPRSAQRNNFRNRWSNSPKKLPGGAVDSLNAQLASAGAGGPGYTLSFEVGTWMCIQKKTKHTLDPHIHISYHIQICIYVCVYI